MKAIINWFKRITAIRQLRKEVDKLESLHLKAFMAKSVLKDRLDQAGMAPNRSKIARNLHFHEKNAKALEAQLMVKQAELAALQQQGFGFRLSMNH